MVDSKGKKIKNKDTDNLECDVTNKKDLKSFLLNVQDKMTDGTAAPVYALSAMNRIMTLPNIYDCLDKDNKELARDIWLRIKQAGFQIKNPPLLFSEDEVVLG
ncbi:MAG: hypothetical protein KDD62_09740 [Bdellovibrionales bacterium]|nr:hypothetical protein [Bdellovibrionales bacterium]